MLKYEVYTQNKQGHPLRDSLVLFVLVQDVAISATSFFAFWSGRQHAVHRYRVRRTDSLRQM